MILRAVCLLVPFGWNREQFAVTVALPDVRKHHMGQRPRLMQLPVSALDPTLIGEIAQHALELDPVGVLQPEGARDFAGPDLAGLGADEGE